MPVPPPAASDLEVHPYADIFPLHEGQPLAQLADDIKANGQQEPIWLLDGKILDGRRRWLACFKAGVEVRTQPFTGPDPLAFVISKNLHRRHLNESERAMVAARVATLSLGDNQYTGKSSDSSIDGGSPEVGEKSDRPIGLPSQKKAARMLNVSPSSVERAAKVRKQAVPEVVLAVETGKAKVSDAAAVAKEPPEVQKEAAKKVEAGAAKTLKEGAEQVKAERSETPKPGKPVFDDRPFDDLYGKLIRFFDRRKEAFGFGPKDKVPGHDACINGMGLVLAAWSRWQKETT